jgi:crossover junction endodeoxyribonuclease RusA
MTSTMRRDLSEGDVRSSFTCGWPDSVLSPNNRAHWKRKADARAPQRREAAILCLHATTHDQREVIRQAGRMKLRLEFLPPDRRGRDSDNLLAASKGLIDGIADAIGLDDKHYEISFALLPDTVKRGAVRVTLEAA